MDSEISVIAPKNNFLYQIKDAYKIHDTVAIYKNPGSWVGLVGEGDDLEMTWDIGVTPVKGIRPYTSEFDGDDNIDQADQFEFLKRYHEQVLTEIANH